MVKKLGLGSLLNNRAEDTFPSPSPMPSPPYSAPAWVWPSCKHPRTRPFRAPAGAAKTAVTAASVFHESGESCSTNSSARNDCSAESFSTVSEASAEGGDAAEAIVSGLRSERRLFCEPRATSSILPEKQPSEAFGGGVAVAFDSEDPYGDFKASMEEMVAAAGGAAGDWDWLEDMLGWYLRANGKDTHGAIVAAFLDVAVAIAASACASSCSCCSSFRSGSEGEEEDSDGGVALSAWRLARRGGVC